MHTIVNRSAYSADILQGQAAFATGRGICENPHPAGNRAVAWEIGWLNECQHWLMLQADIRNSFGELAQARVAELKEAAGIKEPQPAA